MDKPLLTVIIPVYNTAEYLSRCIESVINQTEHNIEVVIINDASTDASDTIIHNYITTDSKINYIKLSHNIGVGNARNIGINTARTKYISFLDSDDWIDAAYYEKMLEQIELNHSDICISGIKTEVDDIYSWKYRYQYPSNFTINGKRCIHALTNQYNADISISPIVNNKIYCKELILNNYIEFDKSRRAQDLFFSFMGFVYADKVSICNNIYYHYYQRNKSGCHTENLKKRLDWIKAYLIVIDMFEKNNVQDDVLGYVKRFLAYHSSNVAELAFRQKDSQTLLYCQNIMRKYEKEYVSLNQSYSERISKYKDILQYR